MSEFRCSNGDKPRKAPYRRRVGNRGHCKLLRDRGINGVEPSSRRRYSRSHRQFTITDFNAAKILHVSKLTRKYVDTSEQWLDNASGLRFVKRQ